jgi:hypothetical protein
MILSKPALSIRQMRFQQAESLKSIALKNATTFCIPSKGKSLALGRTGLFKNEPA